MPRGDSLKARDPYWLTDREVSAELRANTPLNKARKVLADYLDEAERNRYVAREGGKSILERDRTIALRREEFRVVRMMLDAYKTKGGL